MATNTVVIHQIERLVAQIDQQIEAIHKHHRSTRAATDVESIYELTYSDGKYVMTDLLLAKAQALNGLAHLKAGG